MNPYVMFETMYYRFLRKKTEKRIAKIKLCKHKIKTELKDKKGVFVCADCKGILVDNWDNPYMKNSGKGIKKMIEKSRM